MELELEKSGAAGVVIVEGDGELDLSDMDSNVVVGLFVLEGVALSCGLSFGGRGAGPGFIN